jgi:hypothetical protein
MHSFHRRAGTQETLSPHLNKMPSESSKWSTKPRVESTTSKSSAQKPQYSLGGSSSGGSSSGYSMDRWLGEKQGGEEPWKMVSSFKK